MKWVNNLFKNLMRNNNLIRIKKMEKMRSINKLQVKKIWTKKMQLFQKLVFQLELKKISNKSFYLINFLKNLFPYFY